MGKIKEKKTSKKIIIMIVIVMLFNFVMPNISHASLLDFFSGITFEISDAIWSALQSIFMR